MDQENEVSKIFIVSLRLIRRAAKKKKKQVEVRWAVLTNMAREIDQSQFAYELRDIRKCAAKGSGLVYT